MYKSPTKHEGRLCSRFKKTKDPKCDDQDGCVWVKPQGRKGSCHNVEAHPNPRYTVSTLINPMEAHRVPKRIPETCNSYKKTINPRCDDQEGCRWVPRKGCVNIDGDHSPVPVRYTPPKNVQVSDEEFGEIEVMRYKELRPREVLSDTSYLNEEYSSEEYSNRDDDSITPCKKLNKTKGSRTCESEGHRCKWVTGKGCIERHDENNLLKRRVFCKSLKRTRGTPKCEDNETECVWRKSSTKKKRGRCIPMEDPKRTKTVPFSMTIRNYDKCMKLLSAHRGLRRLSQSP